MHRIGSVNTNVEHTLSRIEKQMVPKLERQCNVFVDGNTNTGINHHSPRF